MLFRNVGLVTSLPGFALSSGLKCSAGADIVPVGFLPMCPPRSCGVFPEVSGAPRSAQEVPFQGNAIYTCDRGYIIGKSFYARLRMKLWSRNAGRPCTGFLNDISASVERAGRALAFGDPRQ